jgi:N-hydroxyarylamine O-acetyltransferase
MSTEIGNQSNRQPSVHSLRQELLGRVLLRLGLRAPVPNDLEGLASVYRAWCEHVPFDNIRKMISLRAGEGSTLAGLDAADFFENWLANGTGGTCWPASNALYTLLTSLGFDARRAAGSMYELPQINHGTVKVRLDGHDWLVDAAMMTNEPIHLADEIQIKGGLAGAFESEVHDGAHVIWGDFPPSGEFIPCRLRLDPVGDEFYNERYQTFSREESPFNYKLYFRRGGPGGAHVVFGNARFTRTADGFDIREFDRDGLCSYLTDEEGVSGELVEKWVASGSLDSTFDSPPGSAPEIPRHRPSRR